MKLLITGANGQLGRALTHQARAAGHETRAMTHAELDITNAQAVRNAVRTHQPDVVINAAAFTAVDAAESNAGMAWAVNRDGPANLASACADHGVALVHVSTDYVFDGEKQGEYTEDDPPRPVNVYGASKLAGEEAVRCACPRHLIVRTSWLFSACRHNFVRTMLKLGARQETLRIVADQRGKPTSAEELARVILAMLPQMEGHWGTWHAAQPETTTWHGFAEAILAAARAAGRPLRATRVLPIATEDFPAAAKRPKHSALDCRKLETAFSLTLRPWRESLRDVVRTMDP